MKINKSKSYNVRSDATFCVDITFLFEEIICHSKQNQGLNMQTAPVIWAHFDFCPCKKK